MTSKQLVAAALNGQPTPRVPVGPLAVHFCAGVAGYTLRQFSTDARILAESVIRYHECFRPDAVWLSADTWVSAEAMGARVSAVDDHQPLGGGRPALVQRASDIDRIPPPEVGTQGRYPLMLEALGRIVAALGREVFIVACFDQYPFSLAAALMGLHEIFLKVHDDPPFVRALMARCAEYSLAYGRALGQAGADLLSGGDAPAGLLGPARYAEWALPFEQQLIARLRAETGKPVSLHICGDASSILPLMKTAGPEVLEIDHAVEIGAACHVVGPDVALWGNVDPVAVLAQGSAQEVTRAARKALHAVRRAGHQRFVLSSGCTLAVETPHPNLDALIQA